MTAKTILQWVTSCYDTNNPWHYHPEYELTFISNSQGARYAGNNMENFSDPGNGQESGTTFFVIRHGGKELHGHCARARIRLYN
jgi:hypothetical protein